MQMDDVISMCPSFNSYTTGELAVTASRTVDEFDSDEFFDEFCFERRENSDNHVAESDGNEYEEEFEFASLARESGSSSMISAVYPVFNRDIFLRFHDENEGEDRVYNSVSSEGPKIRLSLRKLFTEEREATMTASLRSSSEDGELHGVAAETYCVWRPKGAEDGRCRISGSTSCSSKRWKLKSLLHRVTTVEDREKFSLIKPF